MRSPKRRQSLTGYARNRRPRILLACNQNEPDMFGQETETWERLGDIAAQVARRWWLDE